MVAFLLRAVEDVEYTFCFFEEMRNGVRNVSRIVNVLPNIILNCQSFLRVFRIFLVFLVGSFIVEIIRLSRMFRKLVATVNSYLSFRRVRSSFQSVALV